MELIIKEGDITYIKSLDRYASPEEMLIGAYELISKVYSQQAVIEAYYRTDPDTMGIRND
ncbi:MAG: hypothetical protein IKT59_03430 [Bacteroidales bacterium]|jgi:hypothetical protein|nr:hypothetical protein [Bacteroidales bacterium]